jgi:hypothetical protein
MDRPPVHELSAVTRHSLRFKYRATVLVKNPKYPFSITTTIEKAERIQAPFTLRGKKYGY